MVLVPGLTLHRLKAEPEATKSQLTAEDLTGLTKHDLTGGTTRESSKTYGC